MKQKNMLLVGVAVVCGLAAAVLTTQLSAGPAKAEERVPVLVAAKDLPVGTRLKKEDLDQFVEVKEFTKDTVPAIFVATKEDLADKRTTRTIRKGDTFNPQDVTKFASLSPPKGFNMMSIKCTLEEGVSGFAGPGSRVDVLAAIPSKTRRGGENVGFVVPLMTDMLILAVDSQSNLSADAGVVPTMSMISLAVKPDQSKLLHAAVTKNCAMRLVLRNQESPNSYTKDPPTEKELWSMLADDPQADERRGDDGKIVPTEADLGKDKVKLAVAREDIPAGTELSDDVISGKFEMKEFPKPAPAQGIENLRDHTGKYLTSKLVAGQYIPKSFIGAKEKESKPAPLPQDAASPKAAPLELTKKPAEPAKKVEKPEAPPVFHDVQIQTPNGVKKFRYQKLANGEFKYLGEVPHDGTAEKEKAPEKEKAKSPDKETEPAEGERPRGEKIAAGV